MTYIIKVFYGKREASQGSLLSGLDTQVRVYEGIAAVADHSGAGARHYIRHQRCVLMHSGQHVQEKVK